MIKLKHKLKNTPLIGDLLVYIYRKWTYVKPNIFDEPSIWISKLLTNNKIIIVQIGSNDGKLGDPLFHLIQKNKNWEVIFVEPVPYLFDRLKSNYGIDSRFKFENVAINDGSKQIFYSVKEEANIHIPNLPNWYNQLNSFDKENILKHLNGVLEPFIEETLINGLTLEDLFKNNKVETLDLLHIDTEGYDWKILSQLDLDRYCPSIILFEYKHLAKSEKNESINFLKPKYSIFKLGGDLICLHNDFIRIEEFRKELRGELITYPNRVDGKL